MAGSSNLTILTALMIAAVGAVIMTYHGTWLGDEHGSMLILAYVGAAAYAVSFAGSKLLSSSGPTWLYRTSTVQSHGWVGLLVRYVAISGSAVLFGVLLYVRTVFDPIELGYSELLWIGSHAVVAFAVATPIMLVWFITAKL